MPVFRVTGHRLCEVLITTDLGVGEGPAHLADAVFDRIRRQALVCQNSFEFIQDVGGP